MSQTEHWPWQCHCGVKMDYESGQAADAAYKSDGLPRCPTCGCRMLREWNFPPVPEKGCLLA